MNPIKVIIIDDEQPATELISAYLQKIGGYEIAGICHDGFSALKSIQELNPDLIFLDVQMPKLTGFEMLELIENPPVIIFTTAFDEFAIKAFEMNAVDYLLKPFSRDRFAASLEKAAQQLVFRKQNHKSSRKTNDATVEIAPDILERIVVKKNNKIFVLSASAITHFEAYDDYVIIHSDGQRFIKQKTMQFYDQHLDPKKFIRIHRSWIVNVECIDQIMLWEKETYMVKLKDGSELRASRAGYKRLKELF